MNGACRPVRADQRDDQVDTAITSLSARRNDWSTISCNDLRTPTITRTAASLLDSSGEGTNVIAGTKRLQAMGEKVCSSVTGNHAVSRGR
ncbi:hypothetical protein NOVOSPHI9U_10275 [Novosphingobium sp. 9U]|nr:hypothetical protein NOVOSPHI9U_10275 [Novosphingobium sp. 9U]